MPREGTLDFSDQGFIPEPVDDEFGIGSTATVVPFEAIAGFGCLALLGEPGIGKTNTLKRLSAANKEGDQLRVDLAAYSSDAMLYAAIFQSPEFTNWLSSSTTLEIFLDSLDECLVHVRTVARLLVDEFAKYPRSRLRLRIACRTAEWPQLLSRELPRLWGDENFGEYELAPLTRSNIIEAAATEGLNPDAFLNEIDRLGIAALAMKPLTLIFLMQSGASIPETQEELYRQGCLRLSSYENLGRLASGNRNRLDNESKLALAERAAAVTMFSKRSAIFFGSDESVASPEDITISDLAKGAEQASGRMIDVTPQVTPRCAAHRFVYGPCRRANGVGSLDICRVLGSAIHRPKRAQCGTESRPFDAP